ncbi:MAG TPA: hypothetical protein VG755_12280, partial [Nannocystaceae bacterium]|nr:hypothetical protein [Nannocystaceae bacterium]
MQRRWLAAVLVCACFAEGSADPTGPATTGPDCTPGTASCVCTDAGACDEGLECDALAQQCVPTGCMPGALGCVCSDGMCFAGASCRAGLCALDDASTTALATGDASSEGTTMTTTTSTSATDESSSDAASTTDACMPGTCSSCAGCAECRECVAIEGCDEQTFDCFGECAALVACTW